MKRLWNGLEHNLALGRTVIYRIVIFVVLHHARPTSMAV